MSGRHATGETVREFEKRLAAFVKTKGAAAENSGTAALHTALLALGVKEGGEVIMPSFVCTAVLNAVNYTAAKPVIADINEDDFNISYESVSKKITKKTKAIIIPHMFGLPTDIKPFLMLGPPIIEDCAQALGARHRNGRPAGSQGSISIFSFYATKLISTGHGGMLASSSSRLLERARDLLDFDNRKSYKVRFNYKMTDFQAGLGISQLAMLEGFIKRRKAIAAYYDERFKNLPVVLPHGENHIYHRYVVRVNKPAAPFIRMLVKGGIEAKRGVFKPLHRYLGLAASDFPATEKIFKETLSIPIYPALKEKEKKTVADTFIDITGRMR